MFKDFIKETAGIQLFPIISLVVFILFFACLLIQTMFIKKDFVKEMSLLPLESDDNKASTNELNA